MISQRDVDECLARVQPARMLDTAVRLIAIPSRTGNAGAVADALAALFAQSGIEVERHVARHAHAPAVCARLDSGQPGATLQFNGHLDVVPLPFAPPSIDGTLLRGSGAADMKGGVAAAVEALRALRDAGWPRRGQLLLTAHDLHEAPWGDGSQLDTLIDEGVVGDAVLLPEPLCDRLPIRGRGQACWLVNLRRDGAPSHEVMHPPGQPYPIVAAADLAMRLHHRHVALQSESDPVAGRSSIFIGQIRGGELYNQSPQHAWLEGTRRWIPGIARETVERDFRSVVAAVASDRGIAIDVEYRVVRDAFALDPESSLVAAFQAAMQRQTGQSLPLGPKPFVDDGNSFWGRAGIPAITHGARAGGQHTTDEWVDIDDMARVARVYVETALRYWDAAK